MARPDRDQACSWLRSGPVVALTGAGISAESGIPTFRGQDGWWGTLRPEQLATPEAFAEDPVRVWAWYDHRRRKIAEAVPNAGHRALADLEGRHPLSRIVTQNVDGLHARAGSKRLVELHGDIWRVRCTGCRIEEWDERIPIPLPPYCSRCGHLLRPAVVWFGEMLDPDLLAAAQEAVQTCAVLLVVGTSGQVYPAASFVPLARAAGARVIEVNPEPAFRGIADQVFAGPAGEVLPELIEAPV